MWALTEAGAEVPADYWKRAQDAWEKWQQPDGGWKYDNAPNRKITPAMTAAGIATLFILQDFTAADHSAICTGAAPNPGIERGLAWMDQHIDKVVSTPDYYTLYGIERIGVASGHKYFGSTDWFQKGGGLHHQARRAPTAPGNPAPATIPPTITGPSTSSTTAHASASCPTPRSPSSSSPAAARRS